MNGAATDEGRVEREGLAVAAPMAAFVEDELLPGSGVHATTWWPALAGIVDRFSARNRALLAERDRLQREVDRWFLDHRGEPYDGAAHVAFLRDIGWLVDEPADVAVVTDRVDPEISSIPGPQLVVPVTNARYAINAANARWGSLYDALYGTDALGDQPTPGPYDPARGARVIAWARRFLDDTVPLSVGSHADATGYAVDGGGLVVSLADGTTTGLADAAGFVGHAGDADTPSSVLLRHHGLHVELVLDRDHPIGRTDAAGLADVVLEAAVSAIMDCEDSVATVDGDDKALAYRNWLALNRGDAATPVHKDGRTFTRVQADDRTWTGTDGEEVRLPGRALMLVRTVGHLMTTPAVLDADGEEVFEGLLDALVTVTAACHDLRGHAAGRRNSRAGSVYLVKPKMHGPAEVALTVELLDEVEDALGLDRDTVKVGIMDEERRTSANLAACIDAARTRVAFINTGFLDRTGDEIHTVMEGGAVVRKGAMKQQRWIEAYEDRNVDIGIACGLLGQAQVGKGMWAAPDRMAAMLEEKIGHPRAGATCAWVPSPTAATLHAIHYHRVDVLERQRELAGGGVRWGVEDLLTPPFAPDPTWSDDERTAELENNAQGILGYVVRWVDQGVGCSTVPDIHGVGLMEDRATCRISSQHIANWLHHGVTTEDEVRDVFARMAVVVDEQNAGDPAYTPMAPSLDGPAFRAALALALEGRAQPSGYTEPILHAHRAEAKAG